MQNPVKAKVDGLVTCDAFPRGRGRYEVICSYVHPRTKEITVASHGVFPGKEAALYRAQEVVQWMRKNPKKGFWTKSELVELIIQKTKEYKCYKPLPKHYEHLTNVEWLKGQDSRKLENLLSMLGQDIWEFEEDLRRKGKNPKKVYRTVKAFPSKTTPGKVYTVKQDEFGALSCSCPTWVFKKWGVRDCAHVRIARTEYLNPIRKVRGGWQWGYHGKVYPTREGALRQMKAAYFAGYKGRNPSKFLKYAHGDEAIMAEKKNPRKRTREEKVGGLGLLALPILIGFTIWASMRKKE